MRPRSNPPWAKTGWGSSQKKNIRGVGVSFSTRYLRPFVFENLYTTTVLTMKKCRAPFSNRVTEILKLRDSLQQDRCQYARKLLPIAPQTYWWAYLGTIWAPKWQKGQETKKRIRAWRTYPLDFVVVRPAGIEPAAYCLGGNRSIRLSYERASFLVRQSDAGCQVEAVRGNVLQERSGSKRRLSLSCNGKDHVSARGRRSAQGHTARLRIACAAGAAWGQGRCPWRPVRRQQPPED